MGWNVLAKDLLVDIFQRLINDKRIAVVLACRRVSKRWRVIAESDELWCGICDKILPFVKPEPGQSWFAFYADVAQSASVIQRIGHPLEQDQTRYVNALCERTLITSNALWHFYQPTLLFDWAINTHGESILFLLAKQQLEKDLRKISLHLRLLEAPLPFILAPKPQTRAYIHFIKRRIYHFIWYMLEEIQPRSLLHFLEDIAADKIPRDLCNLLGFWLDLMRDLFPKCEHADINTALMIETTKFIDGAFKAYEKTGRTQFQGPVLHLSKGIVGVANEMRLKDVRFPDFSVLQYRKIFTDLVRAARHQTVLHDPYEVDIQSSHHEEELIQIQQCLQSPTFQFKLYLESHKHHKPEIFQRFFQRTHQPVPKAISLTVNFSWTGASFMQKLSGKVTLTIKLGLCTHQQVIPVNHPTTILISLDPKMRDGTLIVSFQTGTFGTSSCECKPLKLSSHKESELELQFVQEEKNLAVATLSFMLC